MSDPTVFIVDDDPDVRASLRLLVRTLGHQAETHASAMEFLEQYRPEQPGCLVLDVRMPGMTGLELQEELHRRSLTIPVVFISGHADVPMAVRAVQAGAIDFLEKPFADEALAACIDKALAREERQRANAAERGVVAARLATLTEREAEVMHVLIEGVPNKIVARRLNLSVRTVEIHRARVLAKLEVDNVQQLIALLLSTGLVAPPATVHEHAHSGSAR
jgi:two-component system, LuxR family, response regulator FixJ